MIDEFHGGNISHEATEAKEQPQSTPAVEPQEPPPAEVPAVKSLPQEPAAMPPQPQAQPLPVEPVEQAPQPLPSEPNAATTMAVEPAPATQPLPAEPTPAMQAQPLPTEPLPPQALPAESAPVMQAQPLPAEPSPQPSPAEPAPAATQPLPAEPKTQPLPAEPLPAAPVDEGENLRDQQEEEQNIEAAFEAAMQLIAAGQGVEQILGSGDFANLPEHVKQQLRARLQQVSAQREMQQAEMAKETRQKGIAAKAVGKLFSLGMMSGLISKSTMDKINALFTQQPHLQQQIQMTGQALLKAGAQPDVEFAKSTVQIASRAASTPAVSQDQTKQI